MKKITALIIMTFVAIILSACSGTNYIPEKDYAYTEGNDRSLEFCFIKDELPQGNVEYSMLKNVKVGSNFYGSTGKVVAKLMKESIAKGGNAVVNFYAGQRFGFWPWRLVRPVARGRVIKITNANGLTCEEIGGKTIQQVLEIE